MFVVIIGSGRTGSKLAGYLSRENHEVVIVDKDSKQFSKLPVEYSGFTVEGDALEHSVLENARMGKAEIAVVTTGSDKVNYMVAQMARELFSISRILVRIVDPDKEALFNDIEGVETYSPLKLLVKKFVERINEN